MTGSSVADGLLLAGSLYWVCGLFWAIWLLVRITKDPSWGLPFEGEGVIRTFCTAMFMWPFIMAAWMAENSDDGPWRG